MWISVSSALMMRSLFIWQLAFPKGLAVAAGRLRVAPSTPIIFDVQLLYIPNVSFSIGE
jgi:peptidylprolyl isomerase